MLVLGKGNKDAIGLQKRREGPSLTNKSTGESRKRLEKETTFIAKKLSIKFQKWFQFAYNHFENGYMERMLVFFLSKTQGSRERQLF